MELTILITSFCNLSSLYIVKEELETDLGNTHKTIYRNVRISRELSFQTIWKWR